MADEFSLEARLNFIIEGLSQASSDLDQVNTGLAGFDDNIAQAGVSTERFQSQILKIEERLRALSGGLNSSGSGFSEQAAGIDKAAGSQKKLAANIARANAETAKIKDQMGYTERIGEVGQLQAAEERLSATTADSVVAQVKLNRVRNEGGAGTKSELDAIQKYNEELKNVVSLGNDAAKGQAAQQKLISNIAAAGAQTEKIQGQGQYASRVREVGQLQAAQEELARSSAVVEAAQQRVFQVEFSGTKATEADLQAVKEYNAALQHHIAIQADVTKAENAQRQAQEKLAGNIGTAASRTTGLQDDVSYQRRVREVGALAAAQEQLARASNAAAQAQQRLVAIQHSSQAGTDAELDAINKYNAALSRVAISEGQLTRAQRATAATPQGNPVGISILGKQLGTLTENQLPRLRYALYDVSFATGIAGGVIAAGLGAAIKSGADFESEFAQVQRTSGATGQAARSLEQDFIALSTSIPTSFKDLSSIGALGGQLNVATANLADFTKTTAEFSATTNVSTDDAGTALGRLDQLLPDVKGNYDALASSILKVGVNSVATESQIIQISQNIAGIASTVGMTSSAVVGLAGDMASLGIQPEAARSVITRLFTRIQEAIDGDTISLNKFGAVAGMTGTQFSKAFKSDAGGTLINLLQGINATGDGAVNTLKELGLTSVRDIPNLLKMAQNTDLLKSSLDNASSGFSNASTLSDQYGVISKTLSARLQILANSFQAMLASMEGATKGPLVDAISGLTDFFGWLTKVISTPAGQWLAILTIGFGAFASATLLAISAGTRVLASWLAIRTAMLEFSDARAASTLAVKTGTAAATEGAAANGAYALSEDAVGASARAASVGMRLFKAALITTGIGAGIALLGTLVGAIISAGQASKDAAKGPNEFASSIDGFAQALSKDQSVYAQTGQSLGEITARVTESKTSADSWVGSLKDVTNAQVKLNDSTSTTTKSIKDQTLQYGANAQAAFASALANSKNVQALFAKSKSASALQGAGFNQDDFIKAALGDPVNGAKEYVASFVDTLASSIAQQTGNTKKRVAQVLREVFAGGDAQAAKFVSGPNAIPQSTIDSIKAMVPAYQSASTAADDLSSGATKAANKLAVQDSIANIAGQSLDSLAGSADGAGSGLSDFVSQAQGAIQANFEGGVAAESFANDLSALGSAFQNEGAAAAINGSAMSTVLQDIVTEAGTGPRSAAAVSVFFSALVQGGFASTVQLSALASTMQGVFGGAAVSTTLHSANVGKAMAYLKSTMGGAGKAAGGFGGAVKKAGGAAGGAAKEVHTLADYSSDLASTFKRVNDIKFGPTTAQDAITQAWRNMASAAKDAQSKIDDARKSIADANQKARDANATLRQLGADQAKDEYWLQVAKMYGDTSRVKDLQAELAQNATDRASALGDLAGANKDRAAGRSDLKTATTDASTTLTGNSDAAIKNRAAMQDLVSKYEDYISALASSGMPQKDLESRVKTLRTQFQKQAEQLGFSKTAIKTYTDTFGSLSEVIAGVPRDITVKANVDPAMQALDELAAKAAKTAAAVGGAGGGAGGAGGGSTFDPAKFLALLGGDAPAANPVIMFNGDATPADQVLQRLITKVNKSKAKVTLNGDTKPAGDALVTLLDIIKHRGNANVMIDGNVTTAKDALKKVVDDINKSVGTVNIDGQSIPAGTALKMFLDDAGSSSATVSIGGKDREARHVLALTLDAIGRGKAKVSIGGKDYDAKQALKSILALISKSSASIKVHATFNSGEAVSAGKLLAAGIVKGFLNGVPVDLRGPIKKSAKITDAGEWFQKPFANGGYTGNGGKYQVAGIVHKGEYVMPQEAVRYYGIETMARLQRRAYPGHASGGPVGMSAAAFRAMGGSDGTFLTEMAAGDRTFFARLFQEFAASLTITDGVIALAGQNASSRLTRTGAR